MRKTWSGAGDLYTIADLAARVGLAPETLRHYERTGVILPAPLREGTRGTRLYTKASLEDAARRLEEHRRKRNN